MKTKSKDQLTLSFDNAPTLPPRDASWRQDMIDQIRRDMQAYREENESPWWKEFYRERIEAYRASVKAFDERSSA